MSTRLIDTTSDEPTSTRPNKSALKREAQALVELGVQLARLSPEVWQELQLDERLCDALELYNRIEAHGAKARQRARLGKLLRAIDVAPIEALLLQRELAKTAQTRDFHRIESLRDQLLSDGDAALTALAASHPTLPRPELLAQIHAYHHSSNPRHKTQASREIFRLLRLHLPK
jgi:ribosome-associated protein